MKKLLFILVALAGAGAALAQQTRFTYQGRLNVGVNPANGIYDLRFAVFDSTNNPGTLVGGPLTNTATSVSNGLFTVVLDFGSAPFDGSQRWLEIAVRTNAAEPFNILVPRQPITAAPYAIYSPTAGNAAFATAATSAAFIAGVSGSNVAQLNVPSTVYSATGTVTVFNGFIVGATLLNGGFGYTASPAVTIADASGSNGVITATVANGVVTSLTVQNAGNNYSTSASLIIAPPPSNASQTFISANNFAGANTMTNPGNVFAGNFNGSFGSLSGGTVVLSNNLYLPAPTASVGLIYSGNATLVNGFGLNNFFSGASAGNLTQTGSGANTGVGVNALRNNTTGHHNSAIGMNALLSNTTGSANSANGQAALQANTTGNNNTASGQAALVSNTSGSDNTANGYQALLNNTTGNRNTASGEQALFANTNGANNTAEGWGALRNNGSGNGNTANGYTTLFNNTTGTNNTATGIAALQSNTTGNNNVGCGPGSLFANTTGSYNTGSGYETLHNNTAGLYNIALGYQAGYNLTTGSNNIDIGHLGVAGEGSTIRIGTPGVHGNAFIAGVITGNGGGLTNLNANTFGGFAPANFWQIGGNAGTSPGNGNFIGTTDNQAFELRANNVTGLRLESFSGAMNVIAGVGNAIMPGAFGVTISGGGYVGSANRGANFATVGGGYRNDAIASLATIGGGNFNTADGINATVGGGFTNSASGNYTTVAGGNQNSARGESSAVAGGANNNIQNGATNSFIGGGSGNQVQANANLAVIGGGFNNLIPANAGYSTISGGYINSTPGQYASIGGGGLNSASGGFAAIGGGNGNTVGGYAAVISGGYSNQANGWSSTVAGGTNNIASGYAATVAGGSGNLAGANSSFAAGSQAFATNEGAFVWADSQAAPFGSSANNQFNVRANGGVRFATSGAGVILDGQPVLAVTDGGSTIRIGAQGTQTNTSIAGIYGATIPGGVAVYVNSSGQLGTLTSSRNYKEDIHEMAGSSDILYSLQPVTFKYKREIDPQGIPQFGLVAEDVDRLAPQLVARDPDHGIYTVRYEAINAMLLNEFLKEHARVEQLSMEIKAMKLKSEEMEELKVRVQQLARKVEHGN